MWVLPISAHAFGPSTLYPMNHFPRSYSNWFNSNNSMRQMLLFSSKIGGNWGRRVWITCQQHSENGSPVKLTRTPFSFQQDKHGCCNILSNRTERHKTIVRTRSLTLWRSRDWNGGTMAVTTKEDKITHIGSVVTSLMSTWHKAKSSERREQMPSLDWAVAKAVGHFLNWRLMCMEM